MPVPADGLEFWTYASGHTHLFVRPEIAITEFGGGSTLCDSVGHPRIVIGPSDGAELSVGLFKQIRRHR